MENWVGLRCLMRDLERCRHSHSHSTATGIALRLHDCAAFDVLFACWPSLDFAGICVDCALFSSLKFSHFRLYPAHITGSVRLTTTVELDGAMFEVEQVGKQKLLVGK